MSTATQTESNAEYHADTSHVSATMLKALAESPRVFELQYILGNRRPETAAMATGTTLHCLALEPGEFASRYSVCPHTDKRTRAFKDWAKNEAANDARIVITQTEMDSLAAMVKSLRAIPMIAAILDEHGHVEHSMRCTDEETGVRCKARCDKALPTARIPIVFDLKTIALCTPRKFAYACDEFRYDIQSAHYQTVAAKHFQRGDWLTVFGVVETKPPYRARAFQLNDASHRKGVADRFALLTEYQDRMASGDWSEAGEHELTTITLPSLRRGK